VTLQRPVRGRLRRRLAIAFALVGALSSGTLAVTSYVVVRHSRMDDAVARALVQTNANLAIARSTLRADPASVSRLLRRYSSRPGFVTIPVTGGRQPAGTLPLPGDLRRLVAAGNLAYRWTTIDGHRYLAVGAPVRSVQLYFLFDEQQLQNDLDQLRTILAVTWLGLAAICGMVGMGLARRILSPVASASQAARALAEGLLETRLPAGGRDEFGAWAASFNEMADALEAKILALSDARERERRFTADVAHELRTPLTALVNEAAILREHLERMPGEARRASELLAGDVARLAQLVEDLLEISRLEAGSAEVAAQRVDLDALLRAVVSANGWTSRVSIRGEAGRVALDPRRFERIMTNLIGNAIQHGSGDASVSVSRQGAMLCVAVEDHGSGIPPEQLPRVFDRFFKGDPARRGGSGLGLSIARENARLLGGDITARSTPGATVFELVLPVAQPLPGCDPVATPKADHGGISVDREESS
jgi:signal transduction histidine kinase